jgi:hypothetical protein
MFIGKFGGKASSVGDHKASGDPRRFGKAYFLGGDKVMSGGLISNYYLAQPTRSESSLCRASKSRIIW